MRLRRNPRGSATVETAILMIVLIPLIMYTLFLEDLLFYKFDQEETVVSAPWDYTQLDYREDQHGIDDQRGWAQRFIRQTYWDHTSAWNTYQDAQHDAEGTDHHQAMAAHQCWLAQGGEQTTCTVNSNSAMVEPAFSSLNKGGQTTCEAILGVQNYFLPQQLFQWWARVGLTSQKRWVGESGDGNIHGNAQQDPYVFPKMEYSMLHDPWALNSMDNEAALSPGSHPMNEQHKWHEWYKTLYENNDNTSAAQNFASQAQSDEFLDSAATTDGLGDDVTTPPVAWVKEPNREIYNKHTASGWSDSRHSASQGSMQDSYFGQPIGRW